MTPDEQTDEAVEEQFDDNWMQYQFRNHVDDAGQAMYTLANALIGTGGILAALAVLGPFIGVPLWLSLVVAVFGALPLFYGLHMYRNYEITIKPRHKGLLMVWGKRLPKVRDEGKVMTFPGWPFRVEFEPISIETHHVKLEFQVPTAASSTTSASTGGGTSSGGLGTRATIQGLITYEANDADPSHLICFQNRGGFDKVDEIIRSTVDDAATDVAVTQDIDAFVKLKSKLDVSLVVFLTGYRLRDMRKAFPDGDYNLDITRVEYERLPIVKNPIWHLTRDDKAKIEETENEEEERENRKNLTLQEIEIYLKFALDVEGRKDNQNLGVRYMNLKLNEITPDKEYQEAADKLSRENKERQIEHTDRETRLQLARRAVNASKDASGNETLTFPAAYENELVQAGRTTKSTNVLEIPGLREIGAGLPSLIEALVGKKKGE